jgi:surface protein
MKTFSFRFILYYFLFVFSLLMFGRQEAKSQAFITRWNTTYPGGSGANQIIIPATGSYQIDWVEVANPLNNGSQSASGEVTVTFPSSGVYEVSITGGLTAITFNNNTGKDRLKIISIEQWGTIAWTTMANAFYGCSSLDVNATDVPDLSLVTSATYMFYDCASINGNIGHWDVSAITDMSYMFCVRNFNQDLNEWDVSNVTNMEAMFYYSQTFNGNISSWDVSKVTNMRYMFCATPFNQNIGNWNVSLVTMMDYMFSENNAFNQDIGSWDVSSVTVMSQMFNHASSFNQNIGNWNVSNVTEMQFMFSDASAFNQDISTWDVSKVTFFYRMFSNASSFNQNLGTWDISQANSLGFMLTNSGLSVANYDATLIGWSLEPVKTGIPLGSDQLKYCNATTARDYLVNAKGWVITGDGLDCTALKIADQAAVNKNTISENNPVCYPNPWDISTGQTLKLKTIVADEVQVELMDIVGTTVYYETLPAVQGEFVIPADTIPEHLRGAYVLKVTSREEVYTSKMMIR